MSTPSPQEPSFKSKSILNPRDLLKVIITCYGDMGKQFHSWGFFVLLNERRERQCVLCTLYLVCLHKIKFLMMKTASLVQDG